MLVQYTPISSLSPDQVARLRSQVAYMQLESVNFVTFEGLAIAKHDIMAHFPRNEQAKRPGQQLNG